MHHSLLTTLLLATLATPSYALADEARPDTITTSEYGKAQTLREAGVRSRRRPSAVMWKPAENTELISAAGLRTAACCNLGESFVSSASVDVNYSDAATGAQQIRLLGLSGTYVQMLTENIPNFRTVAAPYGLGYVPGPWMHSIQVSKGITSVKQGYEAMSGQINVEYRKPQMPEPDRLNVNVYGDTDGGIEGNADATFLLPKGWGTTLLLHYNQDVTSHDDNGDGFADMPKKRQYNIFNRWHHRSPHHEFQVGVKYIDEERRSGQIGHHAAHIATPYLINIDTRRVEGFMKNAYLALDSHNTNLALILSGSYHDQKALYGLKHYDVGQTNLYANLIYEADWNSQRHSLSAGASVNYDGLTRSMLLGTVPSVTTPPASRQHEVVPGLYAQYALNINDRLLIQPGVRLDHSSLWGTFFTPRLHLKFNPTAWLNLRASAGRGFRTAFVLDENNYMLASSRHIYLDQGAEDGTCREANWNTGISAQFRHRFGERTLEVTAEYYYTAFQQQAVIDMDRSAHAVHFYQLQGRSYSSVAQIQATYPFFEGFTATAAFRWNDSRTTYLTPQGPCLRERPLTSRYKALLTLQYKTPLEHWQFDATLQLNGPGRMPDPDSTAPLWDARYKAFPQLTAQVTRNFRRWSIYVGGENLTNFTQKHPIIAASDPWGKDFDPTMTWGPMDGWMVYAGITMTLPR